MTIPLPDNKHLDCRACSAFCCKMAGRVDISIPDARKLAEHLGLTYEEFQAKHIVERSRRGQMRIKRALETCQFLAPDWSCSVYAARPSSCSGYVCWEQTDRTVYNFAALAQLPPDAMRREERRFDRARKKIRDERS